VQLLGFSLDKSFIKIVPIYNCGDIFGFAASDYTDNKRLILIKLLIE